MPSIAWRKLTMLAPPCMGCTSCSTASATTCRDTPYVAACCARCARAATSGAAPTSAAGGTSSRTPHTNRGTLRTASVEATIACAGASSCGVSSMSCVLLGAGAGAGGSCGCDEQDKSDPVRGRLATSRARTVKERFGDRIVFLQQRDVRLVNEGLRCGATKRRNIAPNELTQVP